MTSPVPATPGHGGRRPNRLIHATSPYLLQHAHNSVDWYPWGAEAIERAGRENRPIFLSIGYSACHWCHVMEREVFEKNDIASIMNEHFVNIKVDREERPDLDDLYMLATQITSGAGGWPMSVWLTPQLEPFYAGTYFPPVDTQGRPGFPRLDLALADAWRTKEKELRAQARRVVEAIHLHADESATGVALTEITAADAARWLGKAIAQNADRFDATHGGFGGAPKFPPHQTLALFTGLLEHPPASLATRDLDLVRSMLTPTLDGMARGGIYDHVGGGFARYSTDELWLVPHFEKMLYDNAQLAPVYARAAEVLKRPDYARVARQTLDFWRREMTASSGAFHSTLDADSEGVEGKYYIWTRAEIRAILGDPEEAALFCEHFGVTEEGNWEEGGLGANVLSIVRPITELAAARGGTAEALQAHVDGLCRKLREVRGKRVRPALDDKILTSWNGLMISALAIAGRVLDEPRYVASAQTAASFLLERHVDAGGRLLRTSRGGAAHTPGFLEDYAFLLVGLLDLYNADQAAATLAAARWLAATMMADFADPRHGGFFFSSTQHEQLFARMKNAADNATPSANGMAVQGLLRLAQLTGENAYRDAARAAIAAFAPHIDRNPAWFATILAALTADDAPAGATAGDQPLRRRTEVPSPLAIEPVPPLIARPGQTLTLPVRMVITPGYHVQSHVPRDTSAIATVARLRCELPGIVQDWRYPPSEKIVVGGATLEGYQGPVTFTAQVHIPADAEPGAYPLRVIVEAQPCSGTGCLAWQVLIAETTLTVLRAT